MNELQELMNDVSKWSDNTFGTGQRTKPILHHLKKEVVELIEAIEIDSVYSQFSHKATEEFADCFMLLIDAAKHHNITAEELISATKAKLEINKRRMWGLPDENGVVEHIKNSD